MRPTAARALLLGVGLWIGGCDRPDSLTQTGGASSTPSESAPATEPAPDVSWQQDGIEVSLASLQGRTVLLHFADAASPSWAALDEAYPDLNAEGATVLGVVTDDALLPGHAYETVASDELASAFEVTLTPAAIVVDPKGRIRGRDNALDADAFFALAAPVLLDEAQNLSPVVPADRQLDAEGLHQLVRAGAVLIDLRSDAAREAEGWVRLALPCPLAQLTAEYLPADLSSTLVFLGPDAEAASELATEWGYVSVLELTNVAPYVSDDAAPGELATPSEAPLSPARRVRG
ncbi:MAG: hypothetical protein Rubg2KO_04410 [Rubricoccaceae bacterium]